MENSYLNLAHYHGRRAENHSNHFRYDKAIENYLKASDFAEQAMKTVSSSTVYDSLNLQIKDYKRQIDLIYLKKVMLEKYIKEMERQRDIETESRKCSPSSTGSNRSTEEAEGASPRQSSDDSITEISNCSLVELEMLEDTLLPLAPLELPPLLDFDSFKFNRRENMEF